jgi:Flp pilus assembly protein TadG
MRAATGMHETSEQERAGLSASAAGQHRSMRRASRGQIIIMFAAALIGLIGLIGLATDLGYAFVERRTMQNAADSGAIAGAHTISKSTTSAPLVVFNDVKSMAQANRLASQNPTVTNCQYVDDTDTAIASCSVPVPSNATGVSVTVTETHKTFFVGLLPGGPNTVSTHASAIAHVQSLKKLPTDGPFLVCGVSTDVVSAHGNQSMSIAIKDSNGKWIINPAANDVTFEIHGPQISRCNTQSADFKGVASQSVNRGLTIPNWFTYTNGDTAGPVEQSVLGIDGCKAGQDVNNCVAFLPIAVTDPNQSAHPNQLYTVLIAPFYIFQPTNPNSVTYGTLIGDYVVDGEGVPGWIPGQQQPIIIRLTK